jgi:hypothetical protein
MDKYGASLEAKEPCSLLSDQGSSLVDKDGASLEAKELCSLFLGGQGSSLVDKDEASLEAKKPSSLLDKEKMIIIAWDIYT